MSDEENSDNIAQQQQLAVRSKKVKHEEIIGETLAIDMIKPTYDLQLHQTCTAVEKEAFSLKIVSDDKEIKTLAKRKKLDKIFRSFKEGEDECKLEICRTMYADFPLEVCRVVSKLHCVITARRVKKEVTQQPSNNIIIADTLCMNDLEVALKKIDKPPRILVNGEVVHEEKKSSQYLQVTGVVQDKKRSKSPVSNDSESNKGEDNEIFYTCPQIDEFYSSSKEESKQKQHIVTVWEESFEIEDFSTNGTTLNGVKLAKGVKHTIKNGDEIGIVVLTDDKQQGVLKLGYLFRDAN
ncbi:hypothetical protein FGO68_gene3462 [Halteria grandinella]|uniref:FHA domain-containing protein n=1 Tax=Halteria grandinella TaxID=5974 RepID=A0A8J8NMQ5_HALGN|nr:hypothetical protein FGO68_gene3462 [Halteria grandinella]